MSKSMSAACIALAEQRAEKMKAKSSKASAGTGSKPTSSPKKKVNG
jgi:hypothetical protein